LKSRLETGDALREAGVPVVEFRASIVIGAGSLSFEMIRALVERLPVMICPRWVDTRTQPIAIDDVLAYLRAALDLPDGPGAVFEIGGPEVVSYADMMREYARQRRLRRLLIPVPMLTPRLSGLWLGLVTPTQARVGRALVEGLRNPTVVRSPTARATFAITPMPLREAFRRAIEEGTAKQYKIDTRLAVVDAPPAPAFAPIRRIGGGTGWYFGDALWRLRGWVDRWFGGAGMPRHRRDPDVCAVGDVIDGWRVEAYEPDRLLRLAAGLKLPGRGWLEFRVAPLGDGERSLIRQTATFDARGVAGRLYWYAVLPLHALIFRGLIRRIAGHAAPPSAAHPSTFSYCSIIDAPAAEVFRWHEQPGALAALTPARFVRIEQQAGGIRDGGRVTLSIGVGSVRMRWVLRHYGYIACRRFCDEQVRGPFAVWRHAHLFEPIGASEALYQDRVEFTVGRGGVLNRIAAAVLRLVLTLAFANRHRVVRASVRRSVAPRWAATVAIAAAMLQPANARAQAAAVRTVPFVDLSRYAGDWFEIARFENRFQRQCVGDVRASYARRADGRIDVVNRCRTADGQTEARGVARLLDEQTHAKLKVRFAPAWLSWLPPVWGDYWIIGLAPDYSWAVVGDPGREYLWILARTPRLDAESMAAARTAAQDNGFDVRRLVRTPQKAGPP
jgi:lipocalin/ligand-binding SRPBCC domain-containing protein